MQAGRSSRTAELVCMGRALAHGLTRVPRFDDPTALTLLPDTARERVERIRGDQGPETLRARLFRAYLLRQSTMMAVRTVAIDDAIRGVPSPQIVILGAGLDGRAWRMPELRDAVVFEVDHPDSQREKRARVTALSGGARDIRFVAVDFEKNALDDELSKAGHDETRATTWIWEGVVMYLRLADVEATLAVIEKRSADTSRLVVQYHSPAFMFRVAGLVLKRVGEPLRSTCTPEAMRELLARHRFAVVRDENLPTLGAALSDDIARATRVVKHMRVVTADKVPT